MDQKYFAPGNILEDKETNRTLKILKVDTVTDCILVFDSFYNKPNNYSYSELLADWKYGEYKLHQTKENKSTPENVRVQLAKEYHISNNYKGKVNNIKYDCLYGSGALNKELYTHFKFKLNESQLETTAKFIKKDKNNIKHKH